MGQASGSRDKWVIGSATDAGKTGKNNEDALACFQADWQQDEQSTPVQVAVVADGIGGNNAGEIASRIAVEKIETLMRALRSLPLPERMTRAIQHANQEIYATSQSSPGLRGMGSTVVLAAVAGERLYLAHAGDSRAYLLRAGVLHRLTLDHTWAQEAIDIGRLTPEAARVHPNRNVIKRYLGIDDGLIVDHQMIDIARAVQHSELAGGWPLVDDMALQPGDTLLLCSDGLNDELTDAEIHATLARHEPQAAAEHLVAQANAAGGRDNITVVVMRWGAERLAAAARAVSSAGAAHAATPLRPQRGSRWPLLLGALFGFALLAGLAWMFLLRPANQPAALLNETAAAPVVVIEPTAIATDIATIESSATAALIAVATTATSQPRAISTVLPTFTPTNTPVPPTPTFTPRPQPTATATAVATAVAQPTAGGTVSGMLVQPNEGDTRNGEVTFRWTITAGALPAGSGYEVFFYQSGQDALREGFGLAAPTLGTSLRVNLADLDADPGNPLDPGVYLWGVRIVPLNGGAARQVISAGRQIVYQRAGGGQSAPTATSAPPTATPAPPTATPVPTATTEPTSTPVP